jgi:hypothetical protein
MSEIITFLAPFKLATGKTEQDLLEASDIFQRDFVNGQPGVLRRELVRKGEGQYLDIIQFASRTDMEKIVELEKTSPVAHAYFAVLDFSNGADMPIYASLATYTKG